MRLPLRFFKAAVRDWLQMKTPCVCIPVQLRETEQPPLRASVMFWLMGSTMLLLLSVADRTETVRVPAGSRTQTGFRSHSQTSPRRGPPLGLEAMKCALKAGLQNQATVEL